MEKVPYVLRIRMGHRITRDKVEFFDYRVKNAHTKFNEEIDRIINEEVERRLNEKKEIQTPQTQTGTIA